MLLLGVGAGIAFNPVLLAAMSDVEPKRVGPGLGHRQHRLHDGRRARPCGAREPRGRGNRGLLAEGVAVPAALTGGYQVAFIVGAASQRSRPRSPRSCFAA